MGFMKISIPALALLLATGALGADRHKLDVDPESEDGILLQRIQQEPTQPRKLALLEKYVVEYPKAASIVWVYEQLLPIYMEANQWDRVIATADGLLAVDPNDLDSAHDALESGRGAEQPGVEDQVCRISLGPRFAHTASSQAFRSGRPARLDQADGFRPRGSGLFRIHARNSRRRANRRP